MKVVVFLFAVIFSLTSQSSTFANKFFCVTPDKSKAGFIQLERGFSYIDMGHSPVTLYRNQNVTKNLEYRGYVNSYGDVWVLETVNSALKAVPKALYNVKITLFEQSKKRFRAESVILICKAP